MVFPATPLGMEKIDPDTDQHKLAYVTINQHATKVDELVAADRSRISILEATTIDATDDIPSSGVAGVSVGQVRRMPGVDARYSAFPSTTKLLDGRLLMVWYEATDHATTRDGIIRASLSTDNGLTWGAAWTVLSVAGTDLRDPTVNTSADGQTVYLTYFKANSSLAAAGFFFRGSSDQGETFGPEVRIDNHAYAAGCSPVIQLENGNLLATWYGRVNLADARDSVWVATSPNGGASWSAPTLLVDGVAAGRDYQEPWATTQGPDVVILYRWGNADSIGRIRSTNGGATWDAAASVFQGTGRPSTIFTTNGTLVTLYRINPNPGTGFHGVMRYSRDKGTTWSQPYVLERANPNFWLYSGPVEVVRGQIFVASAVEYTATSGKLTTRYLTEGGGFSPFGDVPELRVNANSLAVVDSFDRTDGALTVSDNGQDWVAPAAVAVSGGSLLDTTSNLAAGNLTYANALSAHVEVEAEVQWSTVSGVYLVFRLQNSANYWMAGVEGGGVSARIYKVVGGVATQVGVTGTVAMPAGFWHKLRVVAVGDNVRLYFEDALVSSGTDAALNTMPWVGVRTGSGTAATSHRVRNFVARRRQGLAS